MNREFTVGEVRMKGVRLCNPCDYLESRTHAGVKAALANRGGLRAQVLTEGIIRVGEAVAPLTSREAVGARA